MRRHPRKCACIAAIAAASTALAGCGGSYSPPVAHGPFGPHGSIYQIPIATGYEFFTPTRIRNGQVIGSYGFGEYEPLPARPSPHLR